MDLEIWKMNERNIDACYIIQSFYIFFYTPKMQWIERENKERKDVILELKIISVILGN